MRRALVFPLLVACSSPPSPHAAPRVTRPRIVAHRGASFDAPENTLAAFRRAWALGVESVELDVHVTRDGVVVVIHDDTTKRIWGVDRPVAAQTLAELRALDAGRGERIPTLAEVLATVPPGATLFVEIKSGLATVPVVAAAIRAADPETRGGHVALQAFDPDTLAALAAALPGAPAYWTVDPPMEDEHPRPYPRGVIAEARRRGFPGIALFHGSVDAELLAAARAAGVLVDVWTINDPAALAAWSARDVRWIETDRPDLVAP